MGKELLEQVESLEDCASRVAAEVEDEFCFVGGFGEAEKFTAGVLEGGLGGSTIAGDEVGDAEHGYVVVARGIEIVACNEVFWMAHNRHGVTRGGSPDSGEVCYRAWSG